MVDIKYIEEFVPTAEIGGRYFLIISLISILFSILIWKILTQIQVLKFFLGESKNIYPDIYSKVKILNYFENYLTKFKNFTLYYLKEILKLKEIVKNNKLLFTIYTFLILIVCLSFINQGIMWNDELQRYFTRKEGFLNLIIEGIQIELAQGRPMRIMAAFNNSLSFITTNMYVNRILQLFFIFINIGLLSYLIYIIFNNKLYSFLILVFIISFLPVTFEHTIPNAFVTLISIPMTLVLLSFIIYYKYTCNKNVKYQYLSMLLFFVAMMGYEFIVTFVFIYTFIYFYNKKNSNLSINTIYLPYITSIIYVVLLFGLKYLFPTNYDGVSISFVSIKDSFDILFQLMKSSLPTYYFFNSKYQYLLYIYSDSDFYLSNFMFHGFNFISFLTIKNFILFIIIYLLLKIIINKYSNERVNFSFKWIFILLVYLLLPSLPNSISKMYQGSVTPDTFVALPVSYFLFFISILLTTYLFVVIMQIIKNRIFKLIILFLLSIIILFVQISNDIFSKEQNHNFNRMKNIEYLFDTNFIRNLNNKQIFANDLYITKNALAFQNNYWSKYALYKNLDVDINKKDIEDMNSIRIYFPSENYFVVIKDNQLVVLSRKKLKGIEAIKISDTEYLTTDFKENYLIDSLFYRYNFEIMNDETKKLLKATDKTSFDNLLNEVGHNLKESQKILGYHSDGWIEQNSIFKIKTKDSGKIILGFYYPEDILGNERIKILVNDIFNTEISLKKGLFFEEIDTLQINKEIVIRIDTNFLHKNNSSDIRKLSLILSSMEGK